MVEKRKNRPRDPVELAKLVGDIAVGQVQDLEEDGKNPHAVALGRAGGLKGGKARAAKMTEAELKAQAKKAAAARWKKAPKEKKPKA